ncbi:MULTISPECIES: hypothetical protein [Sphingobacterium]|uniref:hypothetical protein n=1 Tax=Sphingobacterium TaxID=28453 RepID=UPI001050A18F|nr:MULTISPECIES: hypothetical protein [Sphingobacterium]MCW2262024.1 hypothetical protein [Sphingobacterium kitahiroshimense]TCR13228.1 hypothetical protein EDF67_102642 [Sphingobacterium sp. JUb78]
MFTINKNFLSFILLLLVFFLFSSCKKEKKWVELPEIQLVESEYKAVIIDSAIVYHTVPYSAFSDLAFYEGNFYLTFRSAIEHGFDTTGSILVMKSKDFLRWTKFTEIKIPEFDLRDPKFMLYQGACYLNFSKVSPATASNRHQLQMYKINDSRTSFDLRTAYDNSNYWYWYTGEFDGSLLTFGYSKSEIGFFRNHAGRITSRCLLEVPNEPSEARFVRSKNSFFSLIRTQHKGILAISDLSNICSPTLWQLPVYQFGGPNITVYNTGNLLLSGRELIDNNNYGDFVKTALYMYNIKNNTLSKLLFLPSFSDTGYAGHIVQGDTIYMSYYDHHRSTGKAVIKTVRIKIEKKDA